MKYGKIYMDMPLLIYKQILLIRKPKNITYFVALNLTLSAFIGTIIPALAYLSFSDMVVV